MSERHADPLARDAPVAGGPGTLAAAPPVRPHTEPITDVWSWTARKYRVRARLLLLLNLTLYAGLCVFIHWLHFARAFDFRWSAYLEPLRFWGPQTQNLTDFVLFPISVVQTPVYGIVLGLLLAATVAVPISVAILYRFSSALPFVAAVFVFAHTPWLSITLLGSCILAAVRPFRLSFRYASALVGLLPVLLYLYLATRGSPSVPSVSTSPELKLLLIGPWLLGILGACTMLALIIFIARVVNYRPDGVAPVMAVMFATPAVLFHMYVGVDELRYRLLEAEFGPRSARFEPVQDAANRILDLLHRWTQPGIDREPLRAALLTVWSAQPSELDALKRRILRPLVLELLTDRREAYDACRAFIADYPRSRYVPCVVYIQARALDTRMDERRLVGSEAQRELYTDFPHAQSEPAWINLVTQYPDSPLAVAGRLRLAQLRLRRGDADGALAELAAASAVPPRPPVPREPTMRRLLYSRPPEASLEFDPEPYLFEVERLRELILANRDDPRFGVAPLQALAQLDPHRPLYAAQLARLAETYAGGLLEDNLQVRRAAATRERELRAERLAACLARFPTGDAAPEALFQLADYELHQSGAADPQRRAAGLARLRTIIADYPHSAWARQAAELLRISEPRYHPRDAPAETP